jgi:hypothetical protein
MQTWITGVAVCCTELPLYKQNYDCAKKVNTIIAPICCYDLTKQLSEFELDVHEPHESLHSSKKNKEMEAT